MCARAFVLVHVCVCVKQITSWSFITRVACLQIWNHPDVLYEALQKENLASEQDLDLDDITPTSSSTTPSATGATSTGAAQGSAVPSQEPKPLEAPPPLGGLSLNQLQERANQVITYEWVRRRTTHFTVFIIFVFYHQCKFIINYTEQRLNTEVSFTHVLPSAKQQTELPASYQLICPG